MNTFLLAAALLAQVRHEDLLKSPNENWLTYAGDYSGQRHSPLKQITAANARNVVSQWVYAVEGARKLESSPLVYDGILYVTNSNAIHALDARTGRRIWMYHDEQAEGQRVNRGAAILGDRVYFVTTDCHLVALNRKTGAFLWQKRYADYKKGWFGTVAPFAVKDMIIVGVGGGDAGIRGFLAAMDAATGEERWRFWTVPAKGDPGFETWSKPETVAWGGGGTWLSGTYDPKLNLLLWTTGNPWPDFYAGDRKGDNLYTNCLIALDVSTGKLKWHFQFTPEDTHDWDAQSWPILVEERDANGGTRPVVVHPSRNGFLYVLDRTNGRFIRASKMVDKLDWATGIDAKGRPMTVPGKEPTPGGTRACPAVRGAANWMSSSYDPETGLVYVPVLEQCDVYLTSQAEAKTLVGFAGTGGGPAVEPGQFFLRAFDPKTGRRAWEHPMTGPGTMWAGTVSTAGGVVFFGDDDGHLVAADSRTGKHLWHFATSQNITASPITYMVDGKQYVTICAATHVYTFGLFAPAE